MEMAQKVHTVKMRCLLSFLPDPFSSSAGKKYTNIPKMKTLSEKGKMTE